MSCVWRREAASVSSPEGWAVVITASYVDPQSVNNPTAGATLPAAWGDTVRADLEYLVDPPGVVVSATAAQNVTSATWTELSFGTTLRDTDGFHQTPEHMVVPTGLGGWYWAGGSVGFTANSTGNRAIAIYVNASLYVAEVHPASGGSDGSHLFIAGVPVQLSAGDYVAIYGYQGSGGDISTIAFGAGTYARGWLSWMGRT